MRNRSIRAGLAALAGFLALGLVIGTVWALWRQSLDLSNELSSTEPGSLARLCEPDATACTPTGAAATDYLDQATDSDWGLDGIEFTSTDAADFKQMVIADDEPFALLRSYTLYAATTGNRGLDYQVTIPTPEPDTWVENSVLRVWETSDSCVLNEAPSVQPTLGGTLIPAGYVDTSHQSTADPDAANKQATKTLCLAVTYNGPTPYTNVAVAVGAELPPSGAPTPTGGRSSTASASWHAEIVPPVATEPVFAITVTVNPTYAISSTATVTPSSPSPSPTPTPTV